MGVGGALQTAKSQGRAANAHATPAHAHATPFQQTPLASSDLQPSYTSYFYFLLVLLLWQSLKAVVLFLIAYLILLYYSSLLTKMHADRKQEYMAVLISLEQAYSLLRFLEATAAPGTQIGTPPRLTRVGPPK